MSTVTYFCESDHLSVVEQGPGEKSRQIIPCQTCGELATWDEISISELDFKEKK